MNERGRQALFLAAWTALLAWGCAGEDRVEPQPSTQAYPAAAPQVAAVDAERERVVQLTTELRVASVLSGTQTLRALIEHEEGYVASASEQERFATFEVRIPAARVDAFREALSELGETVSFVEEAADVTVQHRDLSAQLVGAHAEESRLLALMSTSTTALADVLAVERELARVSTSIAQLEASERDLSARVAMARVSITLAQESPGFAEDPLAVIGEAGRAGLVAARNLAVGATIMLALMAPSLTLLLLLLFVTWRTVKALGTRISAR